jgi:hypothetical protein
LSVELKLLVPFPYYISKIYFWQINDKKVKVDAVAAVRFPAPFSRRKVDREINGFEFHTKMIVLSLSPP